ncbi:hypothetical protein RS694_05295 [Rhodoferax saidenbachensis]|uniref:Uncharacterized protein n=2 Tax=Rhodoferax saidenbachensis TaxID=1484693 RepID=A0A1P8K7M5_9BURK|nr:hypothetical protein RS694_05295 [Rhodoferax saidenbachensis]
MAAAWTLDFNLTRNETMATSKSATHTGLPEGFESPLKRVAMEERCDDIIASIATLSQKSLADVHKMAAQLGVPAVGPYFIYESKIAAILINLAGLVATSYKEFSSYGELGNASILLVDYDEITEMGRHVVFVRVPGQKGSPEWSYIIDVGNWIEPEYHYTTALNKYKPAYFINVTPRPQAKGK